MKINLKDFYPFYNADYTIEVTDEIYTLIKVLGEGVYLYDPNKPDEIITE